jgi:hypothetical protein
MQTEADLETLCHEFTGALAEILAETAVVRHDGAELPGHMPLSRNTPNTMNMRFAWQWRQRSLSGKRYKTSVTSIDPFVIFDNEAGVQFHDGPGRRESGGRAWFFNMAANGDRIFVWFTVNAPQFPPRRPPCDGDFSFWLTAARSGVLSS